MPLVVALAVRSIIQMAVTLGLITLAEKYVLPLINRAIEAIMEVFGVSEEDAKDIMANETLLFAEQIGVGVLVLRAKLPTKIAERLGFTSKGFNRRTLTNKAGTVKSGTGTIKTITPENAIIPTTAETPSIIDAAKKTLQGAGPAFTFLEKKLGLVFLGFIAFNNLIDFGNWNSGAYQKTFQKIFAFVSGGLLVPDEDYRKTKTVSPAVFDKVFNTYKINGAVAIKDPYKKTIVDFTRDTLIDLLDIIGADLLRTTQRASTKDVLLASQLFIVFKENQEAPMAVANVTYAATIPKIKVFSGIISQGALGKGLSFTPRENDLIESLNELKESAHNNLAPFVASLANRVSYELKIVSSVVTKDGFRQTGTTQQVISGYTKDGKPKYRTLHNKFATLEIFVMSDKKVRTKLTSIILGPVDSARLQISQNDIATLEGNLKTDVVTSNPTDIKFIVSEGQSPTLPSETAAILAARTTEAAAEAPIAVTPRDYFVNFDSFFDSVMYIEGNSIVKSPPFNFLLTPEEVAKSGNYGGQTEAGKTKLEKRSVPVGSYPHKLFANEIDGKTAPLIFIDSFEKFFGPSAGTPALAPVTKPGLDPLQATTLFAFYEAKGLPLPKVEERRILYGELGLGFVEWYTGTAEQNVKLLAKLQGK